MAKIGFWGKTKIAFSVLFATLGALFMFILGMRVKSKASEGDEVDPRVTADKAEADTEALIEDIEKTRKTIEVKKEEIKKGKAARDEKAKDFFKGL